MEEMGTSLTTRSRRGHRPSGMLGRCTGPSAMIQCQFSTQELLDQSTQRRNTDVYVGSPGRHRRTLTQK